MYYLMPSIVTYFDPEKQATLQREFMFLVQCLSLNIL